jgi:AICAR transformylase/IMP cyclohydrolase PurH
MKKTGTPTWTDRRRFAAFAFSESSNYDSEIFNFFNAN